MPATVVVDALWGDSGKGKVAAWYARKLGAAYVVRAGTGTNAGHSLYESPSKVVKTRQLPLAFYKTKAQVRVGSGVLIDPKILLDEIKRYRLAKRTKIDYRCAIIEPKHIKAEEGYLKKKIGSVASGTGQAKADFVLRTAKQARNLPRLKRYLSDVAWEINTACRKGKEVVIEGSQGTFLSLALSADYPYVTSDNVTSIASVDDVGLNWQYLKRVVMVVKSMPTRVAAGPMPNELSKEEIIRLGLDEYGTVTGRLRRKSHLDFDLLKYAAMLNGPTEIALTFADHFDPEIKGSTKLTPKIKKLIKKIESACGAPVTLVETGKLYSNLIEV
jgi:adenylosuccinate synthase